MYSDVTYIATQPTTAFGGIMLCPNPSELTEESGPAIEPYPSGTKVADAIPR
jgi:hypothetical protein